MDFIYETPWWLPTGLLIAGAILLITGNSRASARLLRGGLALCLLGITIATVSYLLESPREKCIRQTHALLAAIDKGDWRAMQRLMQDDVTLENIKGSQAIVDLARQQVERYHIHNVRISHLQAARADADSDITVMIQVSASILDGWSPDSNWKLEWEQTPQGWLLGSIEPQGGPTLDIQTIERILR